MKRNVQHFSESLPPSHKYRDSERKQFIMKVLSTLLSITIGLGTRLVVAREEDKFNYGATIKANYGPAEWGKVRCDKHDTCVRCGLIFDAMISTVVLKLMNVADRKSVV